jgi:ABC-type glycerol-3-phosphate transport system permease component
MFTGSIQDIRGVMKTPPNWIPKNVTMTNYRDMFKPHLQYISDSPGYTGFADVIINSALVRWTFNTFTIYAIKTAITVVVIGMAGYAFSVYQFRYKKFLFIFFIFSLFVPGMVQTVPLYVTVRRFGLVGTWWGVILPQVYAPVEMYIFKNYVDTIPHEIIDSARIDGASEIRILFKIMMPLCKPVLGILAILSAMETLQSYIWTLLMLPQTAKQTLMVGIIQEVIRRNVAGGINPIGTSLAGGVIIFMPLFLIFLFAQRYFIEGLTLGGVKQ